MINGRFPRPPFWMRSLFLIFICLTFLVFGAIMRSRAQPSAEPRIALVQDMDNQVKFKTQHATDIFADGRATRPKVLGTVARGQLDADDHLYRGFTSTWNAGESKFTSTFLDGFPVKVDDALMKRGQLKFNTYCMPCHGYDGRGEGPVAHRASELRATPALSPQMKWVDPANLTDPKVIARPDGHIYNTLVNGIRNMGAYGPAIQDVNDRWAIVAYVRALQLTGTGLPAPATAPAAEAPAAPSATAVSSAK
jgi:mono/diheme cytochrome c family protein